MASTVAPWAEVKISSWAEFDDTVMGLPENQWLFRGHSDASWLPDTSLHRAFEDATPIIKHHTGKVRNFARKTHETLLVERFKQSGHLYRAILPGFDEHLEWFAVMQHYGAPTRLLDVTLSPHIAAYFALDAGNEDCAVFAFDHVALALPGKDAEHLQKKAFHSKVADPTGPHSYIVAFRPKLATERLLAQQGMFLVPSNCSESFSDILRNRGVGPAACKKLIIPAELRFSGIERLRRMNLTSASLFPGIDGFCRSLRFQIFERTQTQKLLP